MRLSPEERANALFSQGCNCGAVDIGVGIMHEPSCGYPKPDEVAQAIQEAEAKAYGRARGDAARVAGRYNDAGGSQAARTCARIIWKEIHALADKGAKP